MEYVYIVGTLVHHLLKFPTFHLHTDRAHSDLSVWWTKQNKGAEWEWNSEASVWRNGENGTCVPTTSYCSAPRPALSDLFTHSESQQQQHSSKQQVCVFLHVFNFWKLELFLCKDLKCIVTLPDLCILVLHVIIFFLVEINLTSAECVKSNLIFHRQQPK